jgi:hypothetical protein
MTGNAGVPHELGKRLAYSKILLLTDPVRADIFNTWSISAWRETEKLQPTLRPTYMAGY